ncbi:ABC transporter permease subunit [Chitinophaga sp. XS-30]|uniref:ABC transporter permease subunit n=1 Tax=Chitinophaga sp. XS-30 TaxID=2604421 RepID=UPI0011DCD161|nr:ABC transporter permease subunit [Chitinophaga sp. XS-30]QEH42283.1 ABC transporter permease subunit [Chitinophaga sp. XS-30]
MLTLSKYVLLDLLKNRSVLIYSVVLAILSFSLLSLDGNSTKGLLSLLNITLLFVPIITTLFATIYFFNSLEFIELLLSQPVKRASILLSEYAGMALSLAAAFAGGVGMPLLIMVPGAASLMLILTGVLLTFIFTAIALLIFVLSKDKTRGIGAAIIVSLFFTLLFDGLMMTFIYAFSEYPIDKALVGIMSFNPVDLGRVLMLLQLDVAVLMGYSGALFKQFLGSASGSIYAIICMISWVAVPLLLSVRIFRRKDL